jgi:hypothetical protein
MNISCKIAQNRLRTGILAPSSSLATFFSDGLEKYEEFVILVL